MLIIIIIIDTDIVLDEAVHSASASDHIFLVCDALPETLPRLLVSKVTHSVVFGSHENSGHGSNLDLKQIGWPALTWKCHAKTRTGLLIYALGRS